MDSKVLSDFKNIHLIINPVSGQGIVPVGEIRSKFEVLGERLTVHETKPDVSTREIAKEVVSDGADLVVAYGGDGTILQISEGLINSGVPLAVIPGGTANVFASELEIPNDKMEAINLLLNKETQLRKIDVGCVGSKHFLLRLGIGLEAAMTVMTEREVKDRYGFWAYIWTALRVGSRMKQARYHLVIDGKRQRVKGVTCVICNSGNLGLPRVKLMPDIDISDGRLDVIIVREASLWSAGSLIYHAVKGVFSKVKPHGGRPCYSIYSKQAKEVVVLSASNQVAARDGEDVGAEFPLKITLEHNALLVLAPEL